MLLYKKRHYLSTNGFLLFLYFKNCDYHVIMVITKLDNCVTALLQLADDLDDRHRELNIYDYWKHEIL